MIESQGRRMQEIPVEWPEFLDEFFVASLAIYVVAYNRMPDRTEMNPDLVRAAGFYPDLE